MPLPQPLAVAGSLAIGHGSTAATATSFSIEAQEHDNWCWAAVGLAILRHHLPDWATKRQCDVASALFNGAPCCSDPESYNQPKDARIAIDQVDDSIMKWEPDDPITPDQVQFVFSGGGVIACHVSYSDYEHWVAMGDIQPSAAGPLVRVFDPDPHLHDSVVWMHVAEVGSYRGGKWDGTGTSASVPGHGQAGS